MNHKIKNLQALPGDGTWKKYQEKWYSKAVWLKIFLVALLLWIPEGVKKIKITKLPYCESPHIVFSFPPKQNQGCITPKATKVQSPSSPLFPKSCLPPVPGNNSLVSSFDRNK